MFFNPFIGTLYVNVLQTLYGHFASLLLIGTVLYYEDGYCVFQRFLKAACLCATNQNSVLEGPLTLSMSLFVIGYSNRKL